MLKQLKLACLERKQAIEAWLVNGPYGQRTRGLEETAVERLWGWSSTVESSFLGQQYSEEGKQRLLLEFPAHN